MASTLSPNSKKIIAGKFDIVFLLFPLLLEFQKIKIQTNTHTILAIVISYRNHVFAIYMKLNSHLFYYNLFVFRCVSFFGLSPMLYLVSAMITRFDGKSLSVCECIQN